MLTLPSNARLLLCQIPVRMHKSFEGLSTIVEHMFPGELLSGAFFIFLSRRKDRMKVLYWDGDGFVIFYKRLEKGSFAFRKEGSASMPRREFLMLMEGITPKRLQTRFSL
jgi:transposase